MFWTVAPNQVFIAPNMTQNAERKTQERRTQTLLITELHWFRVKLLTQN